MLSPGSIASIVLGSIAPAVLLLALCLWALLESAIRRHAHLARSRRQPNRIWNYKEGVIGCEPELDPSFRVHGVRCLGEESVLGLPGPGGRVVENVGHGLKQTTTEVAQQRTPPPSTSYPSSSSLQAQKYCSRSSTRVSGNLDAPECLKPSPPSLPSPRGRLLQPSRHGQRCHHHRRHCLSSAVSSTPTSHPQTMATIQWTINALLALAAAFLAHTYALVGVVWGVKGVLQRYRGLRANREAGRGGCEALRLEMDLAVPSKDAPQGGAQMIVSPSCSNLPHSPPTRPCPRSPLVSSSPSSSVSPLPFSAAPTSLPGLSGDHHRHLQYSPQWASHPAPSLASSWARLSAAHCSLALCTLRACSACSLFRAMSNND
ncbi:hypothetical protein CC85DRAFT_329492, partial [Cutaneotrichosporon oleaginosum]